MEPVKAAVFSANIAQNALEYYHLPLTAAFVAQ